MKPFLIAIGLASMLAGVPASAGPLITASEAALPSSPLPPGTRGIGRGPGVDMLSPDPAAQTSSPIDLRIRFDPHGGQDIDSDSVKVTYMKIPAIDLTSRLGTFISKEGIHMPHADVPPGEHVLRVTVKDTVGHETASYVVLKVKKP